MIELDCDNSEAKRELIKLKKAEEKSEKQQRKAFGGLFKQGGEGLGVEQPNKVNPAEAVTADLVRITPDSNKDMHPAVAAYAAGMAERIKAAARDPKKGGRAEVNEVKSYSIEATDVAPTVRIAGTYGGDDSD